MAGVRVPLWADGEAEKVRQRRRDAIGAWDARRAGEGADGWDVLYCCSTSGAGSVVLSVPGLSLKKRSLAPQGHQICEVQAQVQTHEDVRIPAPVLSARPKGDDGEAWDEEVGALFEWVGMAALGSQRSAIILAYLFR